MNQLTAATGPTRSARDFDIGDLPGMLWRRKWIIVITVVLGVLAARAFIGRLTPVYSASAQLMIAPEPPVLDVQAIAAALRGDAESTASEVFVLRSRDLAQRVVTTLGLMSDPEFNSTLIPPSPPWWQRLFGGAAPSEPTRVLSAEQERNLVTGRLLATLEAVPMGRSRVIAMTAHASTPDKAALIANTVIEQYLAAQVDGKRGTTDRARDWLATRTAELEADVRSREAQVEAFRSRTGLLRGASAPRLSDEEASALAGQLVQARAERAAAQARLGEIDKLLRSGNPTAAGDVLDYPLVRSLREQQATVRQQIAEMGEHYGPQHPRMVNAQAQLADADKAIAGEVAKVVSTLRNDLAVARARESTIEASLDALKARVGTRSTSEVQLQALERDAETSRKLLETFLARTKEATAQSTHAVADARMISRATPPLGPSFPNATLLELIAGAAALLVGVTLALLREGMDHTVRTRAGLARVLNTPVLASLPLLRGRWMGRQPPARWVLRAPQSEYAEALRRMYLQLVLTTRSPPQVLLFTSPLPGEGKTSTLLALGRLLAATGRKVVAVDLNLRKPTLHQAAGLSAPVGLGEWLRANDGRAPPCYPDPLSDLQLLPAGRLHVDAGMAMASGRLEVLLAGLRKEFDVVLLDSSPVLAVVDAQVLAGLVDDVVLLVRADRTSRASAAEAFALLEQGPTPPHVVLNAVRQREEVPAYGHGLSAYYPDSGAGHSRLGRWREMLSLPGGAGGRR